jgi:hypothetical protein
MYRRGDGEAPALFAMAANSRLKVANSPGGGCFSTIWWLIFNQSMVGLHPAARR